MRGFKTFTLALSATALLTTGCAFDDEANGEKELATQESALSKISPDWIGSTTVTLAGRGDPADVYYPVPPEAQRDEYQDAFPIVIHLQGGRTNKAHYSEYATELARQGFIVIVPNHQVVFGPPGTPPLILPDQQLVIEGLATAKMMDANPFSPIHGIADTSKLALTGHSVGGAVGLFSIEGRCQPPFCFGYFPKPAELKAGAFFGTNSAGPTGYIDDIDTGDTPVALIQGGSDGRALPERALATYGILDGPAAYIQLEGVNHYGINNDNNPAGSTPDPNEPAFEQHTNVKRVAEWTGTALRAFLNDDKQAEKLLYDIAPNFNGQVTVLSSRGE